MTDPRRGLRRRVDPAVLHSIIADAGLSYRLNAASYVFTCPLCKKDGRLYMFRESGRFKCMKCGETEGFRGAPEYALRELTGRGVRDLQLQLYGTAEVQAGELEADFVDLLDDDEVVEPGAELPDLVWPYHCLRLDRPAAAAGVAYLEGRGVPQALAMAYDVRYTPQERAVAFPVWMAGRLVGWQIRTIDPIRVMTKDRGEKERIKVLSQGELSGHRDHVVMFADRLTGSPHVVICEGPVSALKAHLCGGNVATMGKEVSLGQIGMLMRSGVARVYLALDPDAVNAIDPLLERLGELPTFLVEIPAGTDGQERDLGDCGLEEARDLVLAARPVRRGRLYSYFKDARPCAKRGPALI